MLARRQRRQRLSSQAGFTLPELLVAMSVGMVVLLAGFLVLDRAVSVSGEISDRQEALQRGRLAMELMTRQLRSQVCLGDVTEPIAYGDGDQVDFYADLSDGSQPVQKRTLRYEPAAKRIVEEVRVGVGPYPDLVFPEQADSTNVLLNYADRIVDSGVARPVFRYYAFLTGGTPGDLTPLPTPLSSDDASRTVMVRVGFVALPERKIAKERDASTLETNVYVRIADPSRPQEGPRCL